MDVLFLFFLSFILALSIGTSNGAVSMSPSFGAGILSARKLLLIAGLSIFLGASLFGKEVADTIGKGLVPFRILSETYFSLSFFLNSILFIVLANIARVPIATTEIVVLSVASIGLQTGSLNIAKLIKIILWWLSIPPITFIFGFLFERYLYFVIVDLFAKLKDSEKIRKFFRFSTLLMGAYFAFASGANNAANSVGVLAGAGYVSPTYGVLIAGVFMGLGSILFSVRIVHAVGLGITNIGLLRASFLEFMQATIILIASFLGIPVSINQTVTSGIIGISFAREGRQVLRKSIVLRILFFWFVVPWLSVFTCILLSKILRFFI